MIVSHNLTAINANRQFNINRKEKEKLAEKLSSGFRINRSADDAAGLAISEKMRRQINGLTRARYNAQDGISLVQVADGALSEMHDIMQRMNVLSVQSANDTNSSQDREYLQQEVEQLKEEIGRISKDTTFNEIPVFRGPSLIGINSNDYSNVKFDESTNVGGKSYSYSKTMDFSAINDSNLDEIAGKSFSVKCSQGCSQTFNFKFSDSQASSVTIGTGTRPSVDIVIDLRVDKTGADIANRIYNLAASKASEIENAAPVAGSIPAGADAVYIGHANGLALNGDKLTFFAPGNDPNGKIVATDFESRDARNFKLQVGAESGQFIGLNLYTITPGTLGIGDVDISTADGAANAIGSISDGINQLSQYRAYYGAIQNRLEHTIKNLENVVENTTASESEIRDTDMAKTMVAYSNHNIIEQAGNSMLAQANQSNRDVLSLLG